MPSSSATSSSPPEEPGRTGRRIRWDYYVFLKDGQQQGQSFSEPLQASSSQAVASIEILDFALEVESYPLVDYSQLVDSYRHGDVAEAAETLSHVSRHALKGAAKDYREKPLSENEPEVSRASSHRGRRSNRPTGGFSFESGARVPGSDRGCFPSARDEAKLVPGGSASSSSVAQQLGFVPPHERFAQVVSEGPGDLSGGGVRFPDGGPDGSRRDARTSGRSLSRCAPEGSRSRRSSLEVRRSPATHRVSRRGDSGTAVESRAHRRSAD